MLRLAALNRPIGADDAMMNATSADLMGGHNVCVSGSEWSVPGA